MTLLTFQWSLAVCGHLFSVILASVDISIENVITSGSLPLERCLEGKVRLHYNLKDKLYSDQYRVLVSVCSSEYCVRSKFAFLGESLKQFLLLRGGTRLLFGQRVLLMCNWFCGILIKLHLLLGCSKTADMIVSEIKQHFWDPQFTDLHFEFNFCDIPLFELGDGFFIYTSCGKKCSVIWNYERRNWFHMPLLVWKSVSKNGT